LFVHGCYWHRHPGCKDASTPKSNVSFWTKKFAENVKRDRKVEQELIAQGWRVMVVWECELVSATVKTVQEVAKWLNEGVAAPDAPSHYQAIVDRNTLLAIAEEKVRYRLASYDEKQGARSPKPEKV
jgi:G:T-mismatch repair DNA endonuclease (very short patch repair protein)